MKDQMTVIKENEKSKSFQSSNNSTWENEDRKFMINYNSRQQSTEVQVTEQDEANDILKELTPSAASPSKNSAQ